MAALFLKEPFAAAFGKKGCVFDAMEPLLKKCAFVKKVGSTAFTAGKNWCSEKMLLGWEREVE